MAHCHLAVFPWFVNLDSSGEQGLPRPSLHPHALKLSHDSLWWWVWGNCTGEGAFPACSTGVLIVSVTRCC